VLLHGFTGYLLWKLYSRKPRNNLELKLQFSKLTTVQNYENNSAENYPQPLHNQPLTESSLPPSPNNPPWNSLAAFGVWILSILFIAVIPTIGIIVYAASNGMSITSPDFGAAIQKDATAIVVNIALVIPAHILTIAVAWAVITRFNKYSFTEMVGWKWGGFNILYIVLIVIGFYVLAGILTWQFGEQEHDLTKILKSSRNAVYFVAFMATFTAPLVEETIYRGVLYSAFQRTFGIPLAVVAVTALFAGVHFVQYWNSPVALFMVTLLSLVLTLIRVKSDNLLPCIILHTIFNGVQALLLIVEPYINKNEVQAFIHSVK
jgi:uncharacterized protein